MNESPHSVAVLDLPPTSRPQPAPPLPVPRGGLLGWLLRSIPNLLILGLLAAVGYWGHHTGWKLPTFAELTGNAKEEKKDWCDEHSVPDSECIECNAKLMPRCKPTGWCSVHGVHECPFEHPEIAQLKYAPQISPETLKRADEALKFKERAPNVSKCKLHLRRIQFADEKAVAKAGIEVETVLEGLITESVTANGEISYDKNRVASLATPVPGRVWHVFKEQGQAVTRGEVLALVDAAEVGKAKADFLLALTQVDLKSKGLERMKPLEGGSVSRAQIQEAEAALREAQARLVGTQQALINLGMAVRAEDMKGLAPDEVNRRMQFLGLPETVVRSLDARTTTANLVPVRATLDGVVVFRKAVAGEMADPSKTLFVVADTRQMWLTLHVRQEDVRYLRARDPLSRKPGQPVRFRSDALPQEMTGEVVWISTEVDEKTRTVEVRADLPNREGLLRNSTFGTGQVVLREEPKAIIVPSEAVHWEGDCHVVFVRDKNYFSKGAPKVFHTRTVRPGARDGKVTEIIAGVLPGEEVATRGSGLLRSELLKNNLGAG